MEQYIIKTKSLMEAVRKIKKQLGTMYTVQMKLTEQTMVFGVHDEFFLVYREEQKDYLVFDDEEAVAEYLGRREQHDYISHFMTGEKVGKYQIWKYVHDYIYQDEPLLLQDYKRVRFKKSGSMGMNCYIKKPVYLTAQTFLNWSVG